MRSYLVVSALLVALTFALSVPSASADSLPSRAFKKWGMHKLEDWAANKLDLDPSDVEKFVDAIRVSNVDAGVIYESWKNSDLSSLLKAMNLGWSQRRKIEKAIDTYFNMDASSWLADKVKDTIKDRAKDSIKDKAKDKAKEKFHFTLNPFKWAWWGFTSSLSIVWSLFSFTFGTVWSLFTSPFRTAWTVLDIMGLAFLLTRKRNAPASSPDSTEPTQVDVKVPGAADFSLDRFIGGLNWTGRMLFGDRIWSFVRYGTGYLPSDFVSMAKTNITNGFLYSRAYVRALLGGESATAYQYLHRAFYMGVALFSWASHVLSFYGRVRHYAILGFSAFFFGSIFSAILPSIITSPIKSLIWRMGDVGAIYMLWSFMRWNSGKLALANKNLGTGISSSSGDVQSSNLQSKFSGKQVFDSSSDQSDLDKSKSQYADKSMYSESAGRDRFSQSSSISAH